ncbi:MAG: hypothetical protein IJL06_05945 [Kiritimatiellae bacterium]|nr:hypothetical protein [Kiritimatiellia bacterium]
MPDATIMRENVPIPADVAERIDRAAPRFGGTPDALAAAALLFFSGRLTASGVPPIQQEHLALGLARHSFDRAVKRPAMEVAR